MITHNGLLLALLKDVLLQFWEKEILFCAVSSELAAKLRQMELGTPQPAIS